jgi:hypothetical protein
VSAWESTYGTEIPRAVARHNARRRRRYVNAETTSYGTSVSSPACEHCDGVESSLVREDALRGWICPICDCQLDELFSEP